MLTVARYPHPSFYSSKGHVGGLSKTDKEIFDFTDSRLIHPPTENISNKPLAGEKVTTYRRSIRSTVESQVQDYNTGQMLGKLRVTPGDDELLLMRVM